LSKREKDNGWGRKVRVAVRDRVACVKKRGASVGAGCSAGGKVRAAGFRGKGMRCRASFEGGGVLASGGTKV